MHADVTWADKKTNVSRGRLRRACTRACTIIALLCSFNSKAHMRLRFRADHSLLLFMAILASQILLCDLYDFHRNTKQISLVRRQRATLGESTECRHRCERLLERSLARIGYSPEIISDAYGSISVHRVVGRSDNIGKSFKENNTYFNDICWKYFDYSDCSKQCEAPIPSAMRTFPRNSPRKKRRQSVERRFHIATKLLLKDCKISAPKKLLDQFRCVHKFRTFLDVQCSSYAKEALRLRILGIDPTPSSSPNRRESFLRDITEPNIFIMPSKNNSDKEVCRFLHYHSMCLSNSIYQFCPLTTRANSGGNGGGGNDDDNALEDASSIFNRFTLRDYFLSFILPLPRQEELFSDVLLDDCQLYDFQKMAKDIYASTKTYSFSGESGDVTKVPRTNHVNIVSDQTLNTVEVTKPKRRSTADFTTRPDVDTSTLTTVHHRLFSSEEDLADTPPNFYYSSAKYEKDGAAYNYYYSTATAKSRNQEDDLSSSSSASIEIDGLSSIKPSSYARTILSTDKPPQEVTTARSNEKNEHGFSKPVVSVTYPDKLPETKLPARQERIKNVERDSGTILDSMRTESSEQLEDEYETTKWKTITTKPTEKQPSSYIDNINENNNNQKRPTVVSKATNNNHDVRNKQNNNNQNKINGKKSDWIESSSKITSYDDQLMKTAKYDQHVEILRNNGDAIDSNRRTTRPDIEIVDSNNNPSWTTLTSSLPNKIKQSPTPMFVEPRVHVKKIIPYNNDTNDISSNSFEEESGSLEYNDYSSKEGNYNWDEYYAQNKEITENGDQYHDNGKAWDSDGAYLDYYTSTLAAGDDEDTTQYTIDTAEPENFLVFATKRVPVVSTRTSSGAPTNVKPVAGEQLETWLVLLGLYSAFFIIALLSLLCVGCVYIIRCYQMYRRSGTPLKWSWISFDMQEQI